MKSKNSWEERERREKVKSGLIWGGVLTLCASGAIISAPLIANDISKTNSTQENIVLHHVKEDSSTYIKTRERAAFAIADAYLYKEKGIRVTTLDDGADIEKSGGWIHSTASYYNSLIKEISKYESGAFVAVDPRSQEYNDILDSRTFLAKSLYDNKVFNQTENAELTALANFINANMDTSKIKWEGGDTGLVLIAAVLSTIVTLGAVAITGTLLEY